MRPHPIRDPPRPPPGTATAKHEDDMTDDLISRKAALTLFEANENIPTQSVRSLIRALPAAAAQRRGARDTRHIATSPAAMIATG